MNDKDFLMDILETEKCMSVNMTYALNEASCKYLYDKYFKMFKELNKLVKDIFGLAYNKGYYKLEQEEQKKITDTYTMLSKEIKK